MSFFSTTATLYHVTPLPPGATPAEAIPLVHNHDILIRLDPDLMSYETLPSPEDAPNTKRYKVTDHLRSVPKGLWGSTVSFESLITNTEEGIEWQIKAPLGLSQQTTWKIVRSADLEKGKGKAVEEGEGEAGEEKSEWSLVEDVLISGSRFIVGTVKGKCEENWRGIHGRLLDHLKKTPAETPAVTTPAGAVATAAA